MKTIRTRNNGKKQFDIDPKPMGFGFLKIFKNQNQ
jgi:hypothetical protein